MLVEFNEEISGKLHALVQHKPVDPYEKDTTQPLVDIDVLIDEDRVVFEFLPPKCYTNLAIEQHWGVATKRGYQIGLGMGRATDPENFKDCMGVLSAQRYMRNWISQLHQCLPEELFWEPQGVSFKAGSSILILHKGSTGS